MTVVEKYDLMLRRGLLARPRLELVSRGATVNLHYNKLFINNTLMIEVRKNDALENICMILS